MNLKQKIVAVLLAIVALFGGGYTATKVGSVSEGSAYNSINTNTASSNKDLIKLGYGTLGSVIITGAAAGTFEIYDATTTNSVLRTVVATSSLIKLASFPTNAAVGTYTFDTAFTQGLIVAFTGAQGTTTITLR
jgi:hypothetical protein